jgi:hypothetical protein
MMNSKALVIRGMPVLSGDHKPEGALQLVDQRQYRISLRHWDGAAREKIVL